MRQACRSLELSVEGGRSPSLIDDQVRIPAGAGDVRGRVGRELARVDRDVETAALKQSRGREPDHPTPEHGGGAAAAARRYLFDGQLRGTPGQGHAAATVSVVVNQQFVAERLRSHDEA